MIFPYMPPVTSMLPEPDKRPVDVVQVRRGYCAYDLKVLCIDAVYVGADAHFLRPQRLRQAGDQLIARQDIDAFDGVRHHIAVEHGHDARGEHPVDHVQAHMLDPAVLQHAGR